MQPTTIDFPLAIGLDTKTDPKITRGMTVLENGIIEESGTVKKRPGLRRLRQYLSGGSIVEGAALFDFAGGPVALLRSSIPDPVVAGVDSDTAGWAYHAYDKQAGGWASVGESANLSFKAVLTVPGAIRGGHVTWSAIGANSKYLVTVYAVLSTTTAFYFAAHTHDGQLVAETSITTGATTFDGFEVFGMQDGSFVVIYSAALRLKASRWTVETNTLSSALDIAGANTFGNPWTAAYARSSGGLAGADAVVVACTNVATDLMSMHWVYINSSGALVNGRTTNVAGNVGDPARVAGLGIYQGLSTGEASEPYIWIAWYLTTLAKTLSVRSYDPTGTAATSEKTTAFGVGDTIHGAGIVVLKKFAQPSTAEARGYLGVQVDTGGAGTTITNKYYRLLSDGTLNSIGATLDVNVDPARQDDGGSIADLDAGLGVMQPFSIDLQEAYFPHAYMFAVASGAGWFQGQAQGLAASGQFFYNPRSGQPHVGGLVHPFSALPHTHGDTAGTPHYGGRHPAHLADGRVVVCVRRRDANPSSVFYGIDSVVAIIVDPKPIAPAAVKVGQGLVLGGPVVGWFDGAFQELGHFLPPETPALTRVVGGGSLSGATYSVRTVFEWIDRLGNKHRSAASLAATKTVSAADRLDVAQRAVPFAHPDRKRGDIRILVFRTVGDGSTHFQDPIAVSSAVPLASTTDAATTTPRATVADTTLDDNEVLALDAGELEPCAPPAMRAIWGRRDRIFGVPQDAPTHLWPSKPLESGKGPEFSIDQVLTFEKGGPINAGVCMDSTTVLFKAASIVAFSGDGPNALGQGSFSTPVDIASDVGAESQNSVVLTRIGTIFKGVKGWFLLDRSLQVDEKIGLPIAAYKDRTVLASLVLEDRDEAVILLDKATLLVLDLTHKIWQTRALPTEMAHAAVVAGKLHFLSKTGVLWVEDKSITHDDGKRFSLRLGTPWFKPSQLPEQRVWRIGVLGDRGSKDFVVKMSIYYDYDDTEPVQTVLIDTADLEIDASGNLIFEVTPETTRAQAVRIVLEDVDGQGEDFALSSLTLDAGVARHLGRQRPSRRG